MRALVLLCCSVVTSALTVGTGLTGHDGRLAPACGPACISTAQTAVRPRASTAQMGLMDWLTGLLYEDQLKASLNRRGSPDKAGSAALSRLKVVLAHDRTGLDEATMGKIRAEIQQVVAKYVYIETSDVQFDLVSDDKSARLPPPPPCSPVWVQPPPHASLSHTRYGNISLAWGSA